MKHIIKAALISSVFLILSACGLSHSEKEDIIKKSSQVAIEYIKKNEKKDLVVDNVEFTSAIGGGSVFVHGHLKDKKKEKYSVSVSYQQDYKVQSIGYGE